MKGWLLQLNLKLNCLIFFYQSKQFTDYIYTDIYCKLSKCIGQTPCLYEHYLVYHKNYCKFFFIITLLKTIKIHDYDTKNKNLFHLPTVNLCYGPRAINFKGCNFWNQLAEDIKNVQYITTFNNNNNNNNNLTCKAPVCAKKTSVALSTFYAQTYGIILQWTVFVLKLKIVTFWLVM